MCFVPLTDLDRVRAASLARERAERRCGLIPNFGKANRPKYSTINARLETLEIAASYKGPWQRGQRCMQVANGFYEWHVESDGRKFPYYVHLSDQEVFGFASMWDRSRKADAGDLEPKISKPGSPVQQMRLLPSSGSTPAT